MPKIEDIYKYIKKSRSGFLLFVLIIPLVFASGARITDRTGESVTRTTLKNGLRVVLVQNSLAPVVTTVVNYIVGSNDAPKGFPGTAHALEHMMFRGNPGLSSEQLADLTATMGGVFNANTQQTVTQYYFTVPSEDLNTVLHIESMRMKGLLESEMLWEEERKAIEQEVAQDLSSPEYIFYTKLLSAMFKNSPYETDPLGSTQSFDKTTGRMIKDFYDKWYVPNNAILVVSGNFESKNVISDIEELFGSIPPKELPPRREVTFERVQPRQLEFKTDIPYGLAIISFRMPGYSSPDYAPARLLADILNSQQSGFFNLAVKGSAMFTEFSMYTMPEAGLAFAIAGFPKGSDPDPLLSEIKAVLNEMQKNGITNEMLEAAKRHEITAQELQKNSIVDQAMSWSQAIAVQGLESPDQTVLFSKVTAEDADRVFKEYVNQNKAIVAVLKPGDSGKPFSVKPSQRTENINLSHTRNVKLPDWARKTLTNTTMPALLKPKVKTLSNGIRLIVQTASISNTVCVYGRVLNNPQIQTPEGKEGIDEVLDNLFSFGTESFDRIEFQNELDMIGANESAGTNFYIQTLTEFFDRGIELLAENELRPAFPEKNFKIIRRQVADSAAGQLQNPDYQTDRALKTALLPVDDPSLREATPETVMSISLQDVKNYYNNVFRPDMTIMVVTGNIDPDDAVTAIEEYFGRWKGKGQKPDIFFPPVPVNKQDFIFIPNSSRVQDKVELAEIVNLRRIDPDYYALELGNNVLGGGFYATRLYQDLREKTGLVYFVASSFDADKYRIVYRINYACDPDNTEKARTIVERNLMEMQKEPVSLYTLQQARSMALRRIVLSEAGLDSIAQGYIHRSELDLPLDEPARAAGFYTSLTPEQIRAAFSKYIRPSGFVQSIQGPKPE